MKMFMAFISALLTLMAFPLHGFAITATSLQLSQASGLVNGSYSAKAGNFQYDHGTTSSTSYDNHGAVLSQYANGQTLQCGGYKFVQGNGIVNIKAGNSVSIINPAKFIKVYGATRYKEVATAGGYYIQKHFIHSINIAGCSLNLDQAIAPSLQYQYVVHQLYGINANKTLTSTGSGYCLPNTNTLISNMAIDQYERNGKFYLENSNSSSYQINANCAGYYQVDVYYLVNGGTPVHYKTYYWLVKVSTIQKSIDVSPVLPSSSTQSNPKPDVWISQ